MNNIVSVVFFSISFKSSLKCQFTLFVWSNVPFLLTLSLYNGNDILPMRITGQYSKRKINDSFAGCTFRLSKVVGSTQSVASQKEKKRKEKKRGKQNTKSLQHICSKYGNVRFI